MKRLIRCIGAVGTAGVVAVSGASAAGVVAAGAAVPSREKAAHGWIEAPAYDTPRDGIADCLRGGAAGELSVLGALGRATIATDLLAVGGERILRSGTMTLGWLTYCPAVASAPGAATLYAAPVYDPATRRWQVRAGEAGAAPAVLSSSADEWVHPPAAVVAPTGSAVVAWYEHGTEASGRESNRLVVATRPGTGAPFGPARVVATDTAGDPRTSPALGVDAAGTATLGWETTPRARNPRRLLPTAVRVATIAADGAVGTAQTVSSRAGEDDGLTLAVAPDGGALLATPGSERLELYERRPGASAFARAELPGAGVSDGGIALSLASGGGAVVADLADPSFIEKHADRSSVVAWLRPPGGVFSAAQQLSGSDGHGGFQSFTTYFADGPPTRPEPPSDARHQALSTALGAGGEVLVTWVDAPGTDSADRPRAMRGTLAGGFARPAARVGGACRMANAIVPLQRADGTLAIAWTDNARVRRWNPLWDDVLGGGRVHLATFGAAGDAARPASDLRVTAAVIGPHALRIGQPLRLRVRCSGGPCDVRATVDAENERPPRDPSDRRRPRGDEDDDFQRDVQRVTASTTLARGERGELRFDPYPGYRIGRPGRRTVELRLTACAPAGEPVGRTRFSPRIAQTAPRPIPWPRDVRLHRAGGRYRLTWSTAAPATRASFTVHSLTRSEAYARPPIEVRGRGRSRFALAFTAPRTLRTVLLAVRTAEWGAIDGTSVPLGQARRCG